MYSFFQALQGHLSLLHAYYGNETDIMQTGKTVSQWRDQLKKMLSNTNMFNHTPPNKYSGYVYDAVWLYALALDKLDKEYPAYIQDIHSQRSNDKFVEIIRKTDFNGTSGRINFDHGHGNSRLSNIKVSCHLSPFPQKLFFTSFLHFRLYNGMKIPVTSLANTNPITPTIAVKAMAN